MLAKAVTTFPAFILLNGTASKYESCQVASDITNVSPICNPFGLFAKDINGLFGSEENGSAPSPAPPLK